MLLAAADSVRRLGVAIVLLTNSFNKTLTPAEIERVHEEVAEFHAFYQRHGAGKVDFELSLIQIDRRLTRAEIAEVSPNRYYLSRDNLAAELEARGFRGRFDEVIALHAWSNANPDRALQAYGGGAVGPDGQFLGDAGFNSIPVMGRDPNTIGQVLIHEVLHNLDDMFSRSGMPDEFLNSDEMSRNMPRLLLERPGAFLPRYTDPEMLAFAERERQGREAYPWAMQLVYYAWMLERTPREAWERLRYGRMVARDAELLRPLYGTIYTSAANDSVYVPVLGGAPGMVLAGPVRMTRRTWTQADFDGTAIATGTFLAAWTPLTGGADTVVVAITNSGGVAAGTRVVVVRQKTASVVVEPEVLRYLDESPRPLGARVLQDRCCGDGPELAGARITVEGDTSLLTPHVSLVSVRASAPTWYIHQARTRLTVRRSWRVSSDGPLTVALGAPVLVNALVREDRGRADVAVTGELVGRALGFTPTGDGRYSARLDEPVPFGLHWARISARAPDGTVVEDSVRVYVRPAGWIQAPDSVVVRGGAFDLEVAVRTRMGDVVRGAGLPLVAIVDDRVYPLTERDTGGVYGTPGLSPAPGTDRIVVTSLVGDFQRRLVRLVRTPGPSPVIRGRSPRLPPFATALRLDRPPVVDGDAGDWPAASASGHLVRLDQRSYLLTDSSVYRGGADLTGLIRLAWDDSTLYVAGEVTDDSVTAGEAWDTDRVNLVFDMKDDTSPVTYATANPPLNDWQDDDYWVFWRFGGTQVRRFGKVNADPVPGARVATRRTAAGWSFEVAIPREQLPGYVPFVGQVAGLQVFLTDGDGERTATELMWTARWPYTADGIEWRLAELGTLLFVDAPASVSPPSPPSPPRPR